MANRLFVLVLDNPERVRDVLAAWSEAGVYGATVLHSTGMGRMAKGMRDDVPLFPSMKDLLGQEQMHHRTMFTVLEDDAMVKTLVDATESVIGDLNQPNTGIVFTVPVDMALGLTPMP